jgi:hypothetical protein
MGTASTNRDAKGETFDVLCIAKMNWLLMLLGAVAVAVLIERLRRPLPATPTHRMRYRGSTKELAR